MKTIKNIIKTVGVGSVLTMCWAMTSCTDNFSAPAAPTGNTITQVASSSDSLKVFAAALAQTGLAANFGNVNGGQFTAFAPTNHAFVLYLRSLSPTIPNVSIFTTDSAVNYITKKVTTTSTPLSISALVTRMNNHFVSSNVPSSSITGAQGFTTINNGTRLSLSKGTGSYPFLINADLASVGANILDNGTSAANGTVYTIDRVMAPIATANIWVSALLNFSIDYTTSPFTVKIGSTVIPKNYSNGVLYNISNASIPASPTAADTVKYNLFTMALIRAGLASSFILNGVAIAPDYTVFAPTDGSFFRYLNTDLSGGLTNAAYSSARNSINTMDSTALVNMVNYHIVNGRVLSTDLTSGLSVSTWLTGKNFTANVNGSVYTLTDLNSSSQDAKISSPNNLTNAGVVHGIQRVLLPQ